jgi:hypothetical protein
METEKKCPRCKNVLPLSSFDKNNSRIDKVGYYCKQCRSELQKIWLAKNPQRRRESSHNYYHQNPERGRANAAKIRKKLRMDVIEHYSGGKPICACCGEQQIEFLTIDHIAENGSAHRAEISNGKNKANNAQVFRWLRDNGYPEGFQVLCFNCNCAKHIYKICPHQLREKEMVRWGNTENDQ